MLLSFIIRNFLVRMLKYFSRNLKMFSCPQKVEKTPQKLHIYGSWEFFLSAAPTAQNSPELHFCLINSFIQSSLLRSLMPNILLAAPTPKFSDLPPALNQNEKKKLEHGDEVEN